jgi:hypothetical protein
MMETPPPAPLARNPKYVWRRKLSVMGITDECDEAAVGYFMPKAGRRSEKSNADGRDAK